MRRGERQGRIGQVVQRQDDGSRQMAVARRSRSKSQPSKRPIGRLPTSPRNSRATGLLKGAKPSIAPSSAAATIAGNGAIVPQRPSSDDGTGHRHDFGNGHPVDAVHEIHEIDEPHAAETDRRARSTRAPAAGAVSSCGIAAITRRPPMHCSKRRSAAGNERMSSIAPTVGEQSGCRRQGQELPPFRMNGVRERMRPRAMRLRDLRQQPPGRRPAAWPPGATNANWAARAQTFRATAA